MGILAIELALAVGCAGAGLKRVWRGDPDFEYFYEDGKILWTTGGISRGQDLPDSPNRWADSLTRGSRRDWLRWYWPFIHRVCTPLALMPWHVAGILWVAMNLSCAVLAIRWIGRELSDMPPDDWPYSQFLPIVLMTAFWLVHFRLNQVNLIVLAFMVGGFVAWQRKQPVRGGLLMGVAVLMKVTPAFMLIWFALKRQWRFLAAAAATVILWGPVADLAVFGSSNAAAEYLRWYDDAIVHGGSRSLILRGNNLDYRNQGLAVTLYRLLHRTDYSQNFDDEPRKVRPHAPATYVSVVNWPPQAVLTISNVLTAVALIALLWQCRRPALLTGAFRCRMEWALFMLAMLWFMPVLRLYHSVWAYPAMAMWLAHGQRCKEAGIRSPATAWVCLVWLIGMVLLSSRATQAAGVTLWATVILGAAMWWQLRRMGTQRCRT